MVIFNVNRIGEVKFGSIFYFFIVSLNHEFESLFITLALRADIKPLIIDSFGKNIFPSSFLSFH